MDELLTQDELKPGTELLHGQYTIERFLNSGGFGITYLARDSLDRKVVIKECFPGSYCRRSGTIVGARSRAHRSEFRSVVDLFIKEAWSLSKLKHPHIVGVHQVFEANDTAYMALDFVEGYELLEALTDSAKKLRPGQIRMVLEKILSAVGFIHAQKMLHRDISPDNILIDARTGNPVLIDFGAARDDVAKANRVLSEVRVVKDGYSPQEFYVDGSEQGPSSDLYALAATFYHMISGNPPPVSQARLVAIVSDHPDPYVPLDDKIKGYDAAFLDAINKAMSILPKDRLQTAAEWLDLIVPKPSGAEQDAGSSRSAKATAKPAVGSGDGQVEKAGRRAHKVSVPRDSAKIRVLAAAAIAAIAVAAGVMFTGSGDPVEGDVVPTGATAALSPPVQAPEAPDADAAASGTAAGVAVAAIAEPAPVTPAMPEVLAPAPVADAAAVAEAPAIAAAVAEPPEAVAPAPATEAAEVSPSAESVEPEATAETADVAPVAPPATAEVAAPDAVEPGIDTAQAVAAAVAPQAMVLPEGVELIAPAGTAVAEAASEAVPAIAEPEPPVVEVIEVPQITTIVPDDSAAPVTVVSEPVVVTRSAPLSTELAMGAVSESATLQLPFYHDGSAETVIATLDQTAREWMAPGQRITNINGRGFSSFDDIPLILHSEIEAAMQAGRSSVDVVIGIEAFPGADLVHRSVSLPIVPEVQLANGLTFVTIQTNKGLRPVVTHVPATFATELQVGDIVELYLANEEKIEVGDGLKNILLREIAIGARSFNFAVSRDGALWVVSFKLDLGG